MSRFLGILSKNSKKTHIHGLVYLFRKESTRTEKVFWTFSLFVSAAIFFLLIFLTAEKLFCHEITIKPGYQISLGEVPFPAVTICPDSLVFEKIFEFENKSRSGNFTEDDLAAYQLLDLLYDQNYLAANFSTKSIVKTLEKYSQDDAFDTENLFYWIGNLGIPFSRILTKWGLCFNFNLHPFESLLNNETVSQDLFYGPPVWYKNSKGNNFPWKSASTQSGFKLEPSYSKIGNYTYNDKNMFQPLDLFRVIIHSPEELPYRTGLHYFFERKNLVTIYFYIEMTTIDKNLESWAPEQRNCFLEGEKKLKFFKIYTKANCEHECLSRVSLNTCGCIPFFMIRSPIDRICGVGDRKCYSMVENDFEVKFNCQCLESCEKLRYDSSWLMKTRSDYGHFLVKPHNFFIFPLVATKDFGAFQAVSRLGSFLAFAGGISVFSLVQLVLNLFRLVIPAKKTGIPKLRTRNMFHVFSEKLYHLKKDVKDFIRMSSIHGIRNLTGGVWEKIFWSSVIILATTCCVRFVGELFKTFALTGTVVEFDHKMWSVDEIPFPAVIYCPELNKTLLNQHVECRLRGHCDGLSSSQISININAIRIGLVDCFNMWQKPEIAEIERVYEWELIQEDWTNNTYIDYLKNFFDSTLISQQSFCMSGRKDLLLRESLAYGGGFCYTIGHEKIFDEKNVALDFKQSKFLETKCDQQASNTVGAEMKIVLRFPRALNSGWLPTNSPDVNERFSCKSDVGVIDIQPGVDYPESFGQPQHGQSYSFAISPFVTKSDENIRNIDPKLRNCYFEDERKLLYFKKYSAYNCYFECQSLLMEKLCRCAPYYYPRHPNLRVCTFKEEICLARIAIRSSSSVLESCDCLYDCDHISYDYEILTSKMSKKHLQNFTSSGDFLLEAEISIFYRENEFFGYKRTLRTEMAIFLSHIGAFLWLFVGASALSIVEVVHFFTLRCFNNLWID